MQTVFVGRAYPTCFPLTSVIAQPSWFLFLFQYWVADTNFTFFFHQIMLTHFGNFALNWMSKTFSTTCPWMFVMWAPWTLFLFHDRMANTVFTAAFNQIMWTFFDNFPLNWMSKAFSTTCTCLFAMNTLMLYAFLFDSFDNTHMPCSLQSNSSRCGINARASEDIKVHIRYYSWLVNTELCWCDLSTFYCIYNGWFLNCIPNKNRHRTVIYVCNTYTCEIM